MRRSFPSGASLDLESQLAQHQAYLLRFARLQLRNDAWAEDAVSETLLAALMFKAEGHFAAQPADWGNPEQELNSRQFFMVLEACAEKLPPAMGRVFLMREWLELNWFGNRAPA